MCNATSTTTLSPVRHEEVTVCGATVLAAVTEDGKCYFSPRHFCDALGIDWNGQRVKIQSDEVLNTSVETISTQLPGETQRRTYTMLPIEMLSGWLFTIRRASADTQKRLNLFRAEAFHVLDLWFRQGLRNNQDLIKLPNFMDPVAAARAWADLQEELAAEKEQNAILKPKAVTYDKVIADRMPTLASFCRKLNGVNTMRVKADLRLLGFLYRIGDGYRVYSQYREKLFAEKYEPEYGTTKIYVLDAGKQKLVDLYQRGMLTMKKGKENVFRESGVDHVKADEVWTENYEQQQLSTSEIVTSTYNEILV